MAGRRVLGAKEAEAAAAGWVPAGRGVTLTWVPGWPFRACTGEKRKRRCGRWRVEETGINGRRRMEPGEGEEGARLVGKSGGSRWAGAERGSPRGGRHSPGGGAEGRRRKTSLRRGKAGRGSGVPDQWEGARCGEEEEAGSSAAESAGERPGLRRGPRRGRGTYPGVRGGGGRSRRRLLSAEAAAAAAVEAKVMAASPCGGRLRRTASLLPARPPSLSPGPKLLPRDKQTRRQGRPPPPLPPPPPQPPHPPPRARPGSGFRVAIPVPAQPREGACARRRRWGSRGSSSLPAAAGLPVQPGSSAGFWE